MRKIRYVLFMLLVLGTYGLVWDKVLPAAVSQENPNQSGLNTPLELKIDQSVLVDSNRLEIKFLKVVGDSRCPETEHVKCVWRGIATIQVNIIKDNEDLGNFLLADYDISFLKDKGLSSEIQIDEYKIKLLEVSASGDVIRLFISK